MYSDIIIIGAGPAGMSAALYCARAGLKVVLIEKEWIPGGQMNNAIKINNYPGVESISGADLALKMYNQIEKYANIEYIVDEVVKLQNIADEYFLVTTDSGKQLTSYAVIEAIGQTHKKIEALNAFQEEGYVHYCATCDGPLYRDCPVAVIGDGNTAVSYALELSKYCSSVYMFTLTDKLFAEEVEIRALRKQPNIFQIVAPNPTYRQRSAEFVEIKSGDNIFLVNGIFVAIGSDINHIQENDVDFSYAGYFKAGDCASDGYRQVSIAVGDGAIAALQAINWVRLCLASQKNKS